MYILYISGDARNRLFGVEAEHSTFNAGLYIILYTNYTII